MRLFKLHDLAAPQTDKMGMLLERVDALVTRVLISINKLCQESASHQQGQRPVDRRSGDAVSVSPHLHQEVLGLEMSGIVENLV